MGAGEDESLHSLHQPQHEHPHNALRILTTNLPGQQPAQPADNTSSTNNGTPATALATPSRVASSRSLTPLQREDSFNTSSPILTPSGSTLLLPSSALTPLPSPLVLGTSTFPSSLPLDNLVLGPSSSRRHKYGAVGAASVPGEKRVTSEFAPSNGFERKERTATSQVGARTGTLEGLRREEVRAARSRTSSLADELFDLEYWRTADDQWICSPAQYIKLQSLGRGTFSNVLLAEPFDQPPGVPNTRQLALKVVRLEAHDDAPAERITSSARRELDILKRISHPSITRLLAYREAPEKCLFGLQFSAGGDLFDFASRERGLLTPVLVKRIFRELALAVQYLHEEMHVVHRDLKLENILLNYKALELETPGNCTAPLVALTDLGLSRPYDPDSPILTTRCGSTDYAAPEIILGQPYDGRATDAWALGVILYCLLETRLPFDPPADARRPGKVAHRIAMGQWKWYRLARERRTKSMSEIEVPGKDFTVLPGGSVSRGDGGEGAFLRGGGVWEGGMEIVEGLLRRKAEMRWRVQDVLNSTWLDV